MNREKKAITVALYGLLIALAMVLSFVETMIPIPIPVPGIKLGLANLVTVVGLYLIGIPGTIAVTLIRYRSDPFRLHRIHHRNEGAHPGSDPKTSPSFPYTRSTGDS